MSYDVRDPSDLGTDEDPPLSGDPYDEDDENRRTFFEDQKQWAEARGRTGGRTWTEADEQLRDMNELDTRVSRPQILHQHPEVMHAKHDRNDSDHDEDDYIDSHDHFFPKESPVPSDAPPEPDGDLNDPDRTRRVRYLRQMLRWLEACGRAGGRLWEATGEDLAAEDADPWESSEGSSEVSSEEPSDNDDDEDDGSEDDENGHADGDDSSEDDDDEDEADRPQQPLRERLAGFLPELRSANETLLAQPAEQRGRGIEIIEIPDGDGQDDGDEKADDHEDGDDDQDSEEGPQIQLDLGLGVLEQQTVDEERATRIPPNGSRKRGRDENDGEEAGTYGVGLEGLLGRKRKAGNGRGIVEVD